MIKKTLNGPFLGFLPGPPIYLYYLNNSKNIFIVKTPWIYIIFMLMFWNVFFKGAIYLEFIVAD